MKEKIRECLYATLIGMNFETSELSGGAVLGPEGLDLESLAVAELAVTIEDEFGVKFSDEEIHDLASATIDEFVAAVAARIDPAMAVGDAK